MGQPTPSDPLGQQPNLANFGEMINATVDARIEQRLTGRSRDRFTGCTDIELVQELLARGWAVFRPSSQGKP